MRVKFLKNHLDFLEDKEYDVTADQGNYWLRMRIVKEVVGKDGNAKKPAEKKPAAVKKPATKPAEKTEEGTGADSEL